VRFLVIEDSQFDQIKILAALEQEFGRDGIVVVCFHTRFQDGAIMASVQLEPFDAVLLDLLLPDTLNAADTLNKAHKLLAENASVVVTNCDDAEMGNLALTWADEFVTKGSVTVDQLGAAVRRAIEQHKTEVEMEHLSNLVEQKGK